jgi:hypothetical protein
MHTSTPTPSRISPNRPMAATIAYAAAVLFAAHLATYFVSAIRDITVTSSVIGAVLLAMLAVTQHLVVFPIVGALPAPRWAQFAGYAWLIVDMGTDLLQLGGAPKSLYLVLRLGINLVAALWIASASLRAHGGMRPLGVFVAADFARYSFVALLSPLAFVVALPSLVLLPLWFVLAGCRIARIARLGRPAERAAHQVITPAVA